MCFRGGKTGYLKILREALTCMDWARFADASRADDFKYRVNKLIATQSILLKKYLPMPPTQTKIKPDQTGHGPLVHCGI